MRFRRSARYITLSAAAIAASASTLAAQGRPLFDWRGRVNSEVFITMRGEQTWTRVADRDSRAGGRASVQTALPQRDGRVFVRGDNGRGDIDVIQQPTSRNNYTAIVRVRDRASGAGTYRLSAFWMPEGNNGNGSWDDRDRDRDRNRDRDRDRNDRRDRDRDGRGRGDGGWGRGGSVDGRSALRWSGDVDDRVEIHIRGDRIEYRTLSGKQLRNVRADLSSGLPHDDVQVRVEDVIGRGDVSVVQQPTARNGYTAIIRINDPRPRYGRYVFDVSYRSTFASRR